MTEVTPDCKFRTRNSQVYRCARVTRNLTSNRAVGFLLGKLAGVAEAFFDDEIHRGSGFDSFDVNGL